MDNSFTAKQLAVSSNQNTSQQPLIKPAMAVNTMDFNHKMDDHPTAGTSGGGVSGSSVRVTGSVQVVCESANIIDSVTVSVVPISESTRQDVRIQPGAVYQKMKELENTDRMEIHRTSSTGFTPMGNQKPKKGSFQITSVINRKQLDSLDRTYEDADSIGDDYDETNTEDLSSEILDTSKMTDIDQDPSSGDTVQSLVIDDHARGSIALPNSLSIAPDKGKQSSINTAAQQSSRQETEMTAGHLQQSKEDDPNFGATRFRIVKVSNERFVRGRWSCYDYQDSERTSREKSNEDLGSGNSSAASSVHYVPGDDPSKNPFVSAGTKLYSNSSSMAGMLLSSDGQPGHSMPKGPIPNGEYAAQSALVIGGGESAGAHDMTGSTVQPLSVVSQPISTNHSQPATIGYSTPALGTGGPAAPNAQLPPQDFTTSQPDYIGQSAAPAAIQSSSQPQSIPQQPPAQAVPLTQNISSTVSVPSTESVDLVAKSIHPSVANALGEFPPTSGNVGSAAPSSSISPNDTLQAADFMPAEAVYADDKQSLVSAKEDGMSEAGVAKALMTQAGLTQPLLEMVQTMQHPLGGGRDEDESGASTVAIDNKIEQAMDLVKSHLMYAVREEVLVLKEQIKELLEKNSQLEYENNVLRAGASPETLAKLSQTNPGQTQTSSS